MKLYRIFYAILDCILIFITFTFWPQIHPVVKLFILVPLLIPILYMNRSLVSEIAKSFQTLLCLYNAIIFSICWDYLDAYYYEHTDKYLFVFYLVLVSGLYYVWIISFFFLDALPSELFPPKGRIFVYFAMTIALAPQAYLYLNTEHPGNSQIKIDGKVFIQSFDVQQIMLSGLFWLILFCVKNCLFAYYYPHNFVMLTNSMIKN